MNFVLLRYDPSEMSQLTILPSEILGEIINFVPKTVSKLDTIRNLMNSLNTRILDDIGVIMYMINKLNHYVRLTKNISRYHYNPQILKYLKLNIFIKNPYEFNLVKNVIHMINKPNLQTYKLITNKWVLKNSNTITYMLKTEHYANYDITGKGLPSIIVDNFNIDPRKIVNYNPQKYRFKVANSKSFAMDAKILDTFIESYHFYTDYKYGYRGIPIEPTKNWQNNTFKIENGKIETRKLIMDEEILKKDIDIIYEIDDYTDFLFKDIKDFHDNENLYIRFEDYNVFIRFMDDMKGSITQKTWHKYVPNYQHTGHPRFVSAVRACHTSKGVKIIPKRPDEMAIHYPSKSVQNAMKFISKINP